MITGIIIMAVGVGIAKGAIIIESVALHFITDMVGYLIHGIGAIPIIEKVMDNNKKESNG